MAELNAITRKEKFLAKAAGEDVETPEPITRKEKFLAKAAGQNVETPEPITREEMFLSKIAGGGGVGSGGSGGSGGGGGSVSVQSKGVNFYDYDGTLLHSYTVAEAQNLSALPELPTREGLICQGWNYDLATIKSYNRDVNVGATYITDDGKTRLYIKIAAEGRMDVPLYIIQGTVANGVMIDWGDGSATETLSVIGRVNTTHTYASTGEYVISLDVADGCTLGFGNMSTNECVMGSTGNNGRVYCNMLQRVEIGKNVTSIGDGAFYNCHSLASIVIPDGVTSIGKYAFDNCNSLSSITIPNGVTSISEGAFQYCNSLSSIVLPDGVTSIGKYAFQYCYGMKFYDFTSHTAVPTLANTNAFGSNPIDCEIRVPAALYDEWIAATNWATYASKIVAV